MKKLILMLALLLTAGYAEGAEKSYAEKLKALIGRVEERCDVDPDSFRTDVGLLESELKETDRMPKGQAATYRAILHGVLATAYWEMRNSHITEFDEETQTAYTQKSREHLGHVLDDMETLAGERSDDYVPVVTQGEGSRYEGHNMLAVMLRFVEDHWYICQEPRSLYAVASGKMDELKMLRAKARAVFRRNGDTGNDTMLRLRELEDEARNTPEERQAYCRKLEALGDSTVDVEAGKLVRNALDREVSSIMQTNVRVQVDENVLAGKPFGLKVMAENATEATLRVLGYHGRKKNGELRTDGKLLATRHYRLSDAERIAEGRKVYWAVRDSARDSLTLEPGRYVLSLKGAGETENTELRVTSLHHVVFRLPDNQAHAFVLDCITGRPLSGITVRLGHGRNPEKYATLVTNKQGEVVFDAKAYTNIQAIRDAGQLNTAAEDGTEPSYLYSSDYRPTDRKTTQAGLFTDRGIYRPGQTVHVSATLYSLWGNETEVVREGKYIVALLNPDGEEIMSETVSPNTLGSVSCQFTLPEKCKLGSYQLTLKREADRGKRWNYLKSCTVRVEEYKRPTYDFTFQKDTTQYALDDSIRAVAVAETFSGVPMQQAKVSYTIEASRQHRWFWSGTPWQTLGAETVETDDAGQLTVPFRPSAFDAIRDLADNAVEGERLLIRISATITDQAGESHQAVVSYTIPLKARKETPAEKPEPLKVSKKEVHPGESLEISYTPEDPDAYVFYYALANGKVIDQSVEVVKKTLRKKLRCKKEWGDGVSINVFYVKDGKTHSEQKTVSIPKPDKKLQLTWHTFRDHLVPGQQETWTLSVADKDGKAVGGAELLAALYDASLDELSPFGWTFSIPFSTYISHLPLTHSHPTYSTTLHLVHMDDVKNLMPTSFDELAGFMAIRYYGGSRIRDMKMLKVRSAAMPLAANGAVEETMRASVAADNAAGAVETEQGAEATDSPSPLASPSKSLRTNLQETAFFHPHLITDADGKATIRFTLPESLTEWKFQGFVHTDDMHYGLMTATAVTNKDFMVQPQLPRFLRTADEATLQTRIFNRADTTVSGTATLRLLLARDETTLVHTQSQPFSAGKAQTAIATFQIPRGTLTEDVICEIVASNDVCSDGERNLLPVLSTKESVTENIPFYISDAGSKQVDLSTLYNNNSPTATDRTLTIGYTDNPAIDVFHALRTLQLPSHENAPGYAAALYSNRVLLSLCDRLTPASDSIIQHFDRNAARLHAEEAMSHLRELQRTDGAWSWFKGMDGSPYITLAVAEHLHKLLGYLQRFNLFGQNEVEAMLNRALNYLDHYEQEVYERRLKDKQTLQPSDFDLRYMAICTPQNHGSQAAMLTAYLDALSKKQTTQRLTIYGMAQGACILRKFNRTAEAGKLTSGVRHYLVHKPGLGTYFATDRAYYSWQDYRIPTHLAAMRCLSLADAKADELPEMQRWLLRQKQTQVWQNPLNAIDVADLLLTHFKEETLRQPDVPTMRLDAQAVTFPQTANHLTYEHRNEVTNATTPKTLTVEKHSPGISWGYIRGTFLEEAEALGNYTSGELSIERKLYVKQGNEWQELETNSGKLSPGTILRVRHIIHADRDMDFVSLTSRHAACMEPLHTRSGHQWMGRRSCYLELHDTETTLFFDHFRRGTTTLDLDYYITRTGQYQSGIATVQCEYAPEFGGYTKTYKLNIQTDK